MRARVRARVRVSAHRAVDHLRKCADEGVEILVGGACSYMQEDKASLPPSRAPLPPAHDRGALARSLAEERASHTMRGQTNLFSPQSARHQTFHRPGARREHADGGSQIGPVSRAASEAVLGAFEVLCSGKHDGPRPR